MPTNRIWQVQEAKARFSELIETTITEGPQIVTRRGVETAVVIPIEHWRRLERNAPLDRKAVLLEPGARTEQLTPPRGSPRMRPLPRFD
ncbi:MAG: type II toxin-antitoxin system Phd/YefM family antitoxin [Chloroflexi bacterium]|nr:type II toxin-antitoxin system Phd/YefM family antitoxin [Chloroflexota bacterium]